MIAEFHLKKYLLARAISRIINEREEDDKWQHALDDTGVNIDCPKWAKARIQQLNTGREHSVPPAKQPLDKDFCQDLAETLKSRAIYGDPNQHFAEIAKLWSVILRAKIKPQQVALCLDALKTARLMNNPAHSDSWLDKAGYSAIGAILKGNNDG